MTITKTKIYGVLAGLGLTTASSFGNVILTVAPRNAGGVTITASGFLNIDSRFRFNNDFVGASIGSPAEYDLNGFDSESRPNVNLERVTISDSVSVMNVNPLGTSRFDSITYGSFGNGLEISPSLINVNFVSLYNTVNDSNFNNNNRRPADTVFNFDFLITDNDGDLSDYIDGFVMWDSDIFSSGSGQTVTFNVIPEPMSSTLLSLGALGLLARRKR